MPPSSTPEHRPEINYPLVEISRPPIYRAMKYWGKKPHNIWAQFIDRYCPPGSIVLDPFAGSAVAAFEAVKLGRKAIAFDLNPMTAFIIEVTASKWNKTSFLSAARKIREGLQQDPEYRKHYVRTIGDDECTILNYRWEDGKVISVAASNSEERFLIDSAGVDTQLAAEMASLDIPAWHPTVPFPDHPSITHRFISAAGGDGIQHLWTRRNLYILAALFRQILTVQDSSLKLQLLSAFVQTIHLCSKMVIPRHTAANRDFSGSWGRPDYLIRRRQMEQNPLDVFWRSCASRQGIVGMMNDAAKTFPNGISIHDAKAAKKLRLSADINYGAVDVADLDDYLGKESVGFVITDPPYAGLIRYLPLSVVWLAWLEKADPKYAVNLKAEITVNNRVSGSRDAYRLRLRNAFERMHRALTSDGRLVVTFHHQDVREFNDFVLSVKQAGFIIDKVTHQYNRRSGESNVANPYGVSASDFYVRCLKRRDINFEGKPAEQLGTFIIQKSIEIIGLRNEPTPYNFLFESLWPELLQAGFTQPKDSSDEIRKILNANEGNGLIFRRTNNPDTKSGDLWWFNEPAKYINHPDRPLRDRVADSVLAHLRRNVSVKLDDVIGELFREYPNGLTPDPRTIRDVLERYAHKAQGKWKIDPEMVVAATLHTKTIVDILKIGTRLGNLCFVGRREQPERTERNVPLRELASVTSLTTLKSRFPRGGVDRLEMVDVLFLNDKGSDIACLWEVENSTDFGAAIYRGSNAPPTVPKFMVIPNNREKELLAYKDPLFIDSFVNNGWRYLTYTDISRLASYSEVSLSDITKTSKALIGAEK